MMFKIFPPKVLSLVFISMYIVLGAGCSYHILDPSEVPGGSDPRRGVPSQNKNTEVLPLFPQSPAVPVEVTKDGLLIGSSVK